ncbi:MAG: 2'-5' RNA ligase family protein [Candidatus Micrarchaeia archaeon]
MDSIKVIEIHPPSGLKKEITAILNEFANKYRVYRDASRKSPHITVLDLSSTAYTYNYLLDKTKKVAEAIQPFKIRIDGIGSFDQLNKKGGPIRRRHNYVIYLRVIDDGNILSMRKKLISNFYEVKLHYRKFVPHVTISHQDLDKRGFERALKEYRNFSFRHSFTVKGLYLRTYSKSSKPHARYIRFGRSAT